MKIHQLSVDDALRSLHARPEGLTSVEAQHRLEEFGPNQVERIRGEPLWLQFLKEFTHFFAVILWVAAALAFCADWNEPGQGMGALGGAIIGVIVINSIFSFVQVYRAEGARLCQNVKATENSGKPGFLGDPTEIALVELSQKVPGSSNPAVFLNATRSRSTRSACDSRRSTRPPRA